MLATGHQPNYLPYLGFFEKIARADVFVVVDTVQFVKRGPFGWIHRNKIRTADGWQWLSVPVLSKGKFDQRICDTAINNAEPWRRKHWRAIEFNYRKAPHFAACAERLKAVYDREWTNLRDLNVELLRLCLDLLGLRTRVVVAGEAGIIGESTDLVVNLCRGVGADAYLSGVHGREYLDAAKVAAAGIRLEFQDYAHPTYPQCHPGPFVPNLSVIDLLMNVGPQSLKVLRND